MSNSQPASSRKNTAKGKFVFIQTSQQGSVKDVATQRAIKKHVMRDIGKSRRIYHVSEQHEESDSERSTLNHEDGSPIDAVKPHTRIAGKASAINEVQKGAPHVLLSQGNAEHVAVRGDPDHSKELQPSHTEHHSTSVESRPGSSVLATPNPQTLLDVYRRDPFARYPIELTYSMRRLVSYIFDDSLPRNLTQYRDIWYWIGLQDTASFCQVLSNFSFHITSITTGGENEALCSTKSMALTPESLRYHHLAIQHVNAKLESTDESERISDGVLGAVIGFVCYSHLIQDWTAWRAHMDGLKAIVRKRGGISALEMNKPLAGMLIFIDTVGAYDQFLPPYFTPCQSPLVNISISSSLSRDFAAHFLMHAWHARLYATSNDTTTSSTTTSSSDHASSPAPCSPRANPSSSTSSLLLAFTHLRGTIEHLKRLSVDKPMIWADSVTITLYFDPVVAKLLAVRPSVQSHSLRSAEDCVAVAARDPEKAFTTLICCASLLFVAEFRRRIGVYPIVTEYYVRRVRVCTQALEQARYEWAELFPFRAWVLVVGTLEAETAEDGRFFEERLRKFAFGEMGWTLGELEVVLDGVCWAEEVQGGRLRRALGDVEGSPRLEGGGVEG